MSVSVFGYDLNMGNLLTETSSKIAFLKVSTLQICNDKYARQLRSCRGGLRYVTKRDLLENLTHSQGKWRSYLII